jgi:hypothetical protein
MHVVTLSGGQLWYAVRNADSSWGGFTVPSGPGAGQYNPFAPVGDGTYDLSDPNNPAGTEPAGITLVACAQVANGDLHVLAVAPPVPANPPDTELYHTIFYNPATNSDPAWQDFRLVSTVPSPIHAVACSAAGADLQVVVQSGGQLWHAIRFGDDGSWQDFAPVAEFVDQYPPPGGEPPAITQVACAGPSA